jgi:hypothetical protein
VQDRGPTLRVMHIQFLDKDFKRVYAKEKLRENMGQSEFKE